MSDPFVGKQFGGRWLVEKPLSAGGMGAIYVARHSETGRRVALKVIQDQAARNGEFVRRFESETRALAAVSHPNVVTFLDSGVDEGTFYLVMELLEGKPLRAIMSAPVEWRRAFRIAADVCKALSAVHKTGIVHRDLKPENIFLQEAEGHEELAKLIDFGIVRLHDRATAATATATGAVVGTPGYISPEQLQGHPASPASDVYAVGVILYELITGKFPFDAPTPHAMLVKQLIEPLTPPRNALESVPLHVEEIIIRFMEKDPSLRVATARDALAILSEALKRADLAPDQATETGTVVGQMAKQVLSQQALQPVAPHVPPPPKETKPTGLHAVEQLPPAMPVKRQRSAGETLALVAGLCFLAFLGTCGMCGVLAIATDQNRVQTTGAEEESAAEHAEHAEHEAARDEERAKRELERALREENIDVDAEVLGRALEAGAQGFVESIEKDAPKRRVIAKPDDDKRRAKASGPTDKEVHAFMRNVALPQLAFCWNRTVQELREDLASARDTVTVNPDGSVVLHSLKAPGRGHFAEIECARARMKTWRMKPFTGKPVRVKLGDKASR